MRGLAASLVRQCRRHSTAVSASAAKTAPASVSRFWKKAFPAQAEDGIRIMLDGRKLKNPDGHEIVIPLSQKRLANLVAGEWEEQERLIKAASLPMTSVAVRGIELANSPETCAGVVTNLLRYLDTDSILYMQDGTQPGTEGILALQDTYWHPILAWISREFNVPVAHTYGIASVAQSRETIDSLTHFVASLSPLHLAAFERAVLSSKSFLIATAVLKRAVGVDFAVKAARVEVDFQVQKWGEVLDAHDVDYHALRRDLGSVVAALL
ncbi:hypothetical protein BC830DRAFT_1157898 [Chytriomyces sp. MP71]|nr:hypothetical protein BC830DRAFT_1157898 [Chytriomyces sp. MP71]